MTGMPLAGALRLVPGASSTNAKSPLRLYPPDTPMFATCARGSHFIDDNGREWLDFDMALGAVVWGHATQEIDDAVREQLTRGVLFSVPAVTEIRAAEMILARLAHFEAIRFAKSGSEAVSAAVRIARAATGRSTVVCGAYHGWHDWAAYHVYGGGPELGIPSGLAVSVRWLRNETYASLTDTLGNGAWPASVIVCPEHWDPTDLALLRRACRRQGTVLIFDEVKSGIRFGRQGVFGATGVVPDLLCLSKGLANGLPLAAIAGPRELMQHCLTARISGTHAGECLSLAAAVAAEGLLARDSNWPCWAEPARAVMSAAAGAITEAGLGGRVTVDGYPGCFRVATTGRVAHDDAFREHVVRHLARQGIFSAGYILPSAAHRPEDFERVKVALIDTIRSWGCFSS